MRKLFMAATMTALAALGGCDRKGTGAASEVVPFDLAKCVTGLELSKGDGVWIPVGGCVASPAKAYVMVMQPSGALEVLPLTPDKRPGAATWTSGSRGAGRGSAQAAFQSDGNLVVYDEPGDKPIWNSASVAPLGDFQLALTDLGEIIIQPPNGQPIWSSKTGLAPPSGGAPAP